jgi:hypothetical protein
MEQKSIGVFSILIVSQRRRRESYGQRVTAQLISPARQIEGPTLPVSCAAASLTYRRNILEYYQYEPLP